MRDISLVVITKNEAKNIGRCLDSVPFAKDKLVLDSGSTDDTLNVAEAHGARVAQEEWRGFFAQKVRATELARFNWVLSLDADEALSPELVQEIEAWLKKEPSAPAYAMSRLSFHLGRWIHHGGWFPDWQVRLFDRTKAQWQPGEVHERVTAPRIERLKAPIHHWVFTSLTDQVETNNRYSSLGAQQISKTGGRFRLTALVFKPVFKFLETYIWKRGYQDGMPGFIIAVGAAYSMFLKQAKLWEIEKLSR